MDTRKGKPTARWGRKVMGLVTPDRQTAEGIFGQSGDLFLIRRWFREKNNQLESIQLRFF
jgi:hypothetical protein